MSLFAALLVALAFPARAHADPCCISVEEALQAEADRYAAQNSANLEELWRLVADDLVYIHSSGRVDDKTGWLGAMRSGRVLYRTAEVHESNVRTYGNTAIVTGLATLGLEVNGDPRSITVYFTAAYVKQPDGIEFVSYHSTRRAEM